MAREMDLVFGREVGVGLEEEGVGRTVTIFEMVEVVLG